MISTLISALKSGLSASAAEVDGRGRGGGGDDGVIEEECRERQEQKQKTRSDKPRERRASGSFRGESASAAAQPRRRPLVIEWPQVKAFLAMADASLQRKTAKVEVRRRDPEKSKKAKEK